jgi:hypothetical protein
MWWHMRRNHISSYCVWNVRAHAQKPDFVLLRLKCDGVCAETRFRIAAKRTRPFKSAGGGDFSRLLAGELCTSACMVCTARKRLRSAVMWRLLVTHSILLFLLHFSSPVSPCAITFQTPSAYSPICSYVWLTHCKDCLHFWYRLTGGGGCKKRQMPLLILFLYKNNFGYSVENRQIKNDKYFSNYSLGGGRQKHPKPAFTGRRREAWSIPPPHTAKVRLYLLCFTML